MTTYASGVPTPAIPVTWTDDPLVVDTTKVKAAHLTELRASLTALDGHKHVFNGVTSGVEAPDVSAPVWVEPTITVNVTPVKAAHMNELITYLKLWDAAHYHTVSGMSNSTVYDPTYTFETDPVVADVDLPKASGWEELRTYLESFAVHTHSACCECECQCTCTCTCTGNCGCTCNCTCTCKTC